MTAVIDPWLQQHGPLLRVVHRELSSPELDAAQQVVFLVNLSSSATLGRRTLQQLVDDDHTPWVIDDEDDLARLLDYPGRLPRTPDQVDTMREVAYYDQPTQTVLTTFAAQLDQHAHVQHHFMTYRDAVAPLGIHLGLIFRRPTA
ncbi:unnamed protein product [Absidia cylindrospora]